MLVRFYEIVLFVQVSWQDSDKRDVHLDGPMVFLRACVLGQLQHSHLHQPLFPIEIDQQLQFDRVLRCMFCVFNL